ncbi:hypothetical protein V8B97DRAFT_1917958 [Scleroderma yunnanense]
MSPTTVYRRQSMAQLYEKLRAQDDEDDMAWLAQFSPEEKPSSLCIPAVPSPYLSSLSSASTSSPSTGGSQVDDRGNDDVSRDSSDDAHSTDSELEAESLTLNLNFDYPACEQPSCPPLLFQSDDFVNLTESPYVPPVEYNEHLRPTSISLVTRYYQSMRPSSSPTLLPKPENSPLILPPASPALRPTRSQRPSSANRASTTFRDDLDAQVDIESDGDGTDDEYVPSSSLNTSKRRRSTRIMVPTHRTPAVSEKRVAVDAPHPTKRIRSSPPSRNVQAAPGTVPASRKNNPWACPYCKWIQRNHRTPDLKRHIRTHTRLERPSQWVCHGVPLKDAGKYPLPKDAKPYNWQGEMMIGGCGKEFSRRDALKRHLDNEHITCVGDMNAFATSYEDQLRGAHP